MAEQTMLGGGGGDEQELSGLAADISQLASTTTTLRAALAEQMRWIQKEDSQFLRTLSQVGQSAPPTPPPTAAAAASPPPPTPTAPLSLGTVDTDLLRQEAEQFAQRTQHHLEDALRAHMASVEEAHRKQLAELEDENGRLRGVVRRMGTEMRHYQASISHGVATANTRMEAMLQDERASWERKVRALEDELRAANATVAAQRQQLEVLRDVEERGQVAEEQLEHVRSRLSAVQHNSTASFSAMSDMMARSRKAELAIKAELSRHQVEAATSAAVAAAEPAAAAPDRAAVSTPTPVPERPPEPHAAPQPAPEPEPLEEGEPPALGMEGTSPMAVADAFAAAAAAAEEGAALDLTPASIGTPCRPCHPCRAARAVGRRADTCWWSDGFRQRSQRLTEGLGDALRRAEERARRQFELEGDEED